MESMILEVIWEGFLEQCSKIEVILYFQLPKTAYLALFIWIMYFYASNLVGQINTYLFSSLYQDL